MDSSSASKLKEGVETLDRSGPMISPDVIIKPAPHKEAFKEAATVSTTKAAKRASMIQIADGFVNIENDAASRLSAGSGAESNDRSAPQLDPATEVDHSFATSRRSSLHQIKDGFANMAPESASNLKMGVATHDRSAPSISPDVTLKPAMHKEAAKDAAIVSAVKSAKRASMVQIADGFANMDETTAHRLSASDVDVDDRSEPRIDASATPTHEFAGARRASMAAIDGFAAVEPLAEASTHDRSGAMIAPDITLKMSVHREAAAEAAEKAGVTSAKRASLAQIADGFENMDPAVAQRLSQSDVDVDDRSQPVIDAQVTALKGLVAVARARSPSRRCCRHPCPRHLSSQQVTRDDVSRDRYRVAVASRIPRCSVWARWNQQAEPSACVPAASSMVPWSMIRMVRWFDDPDGAQARVRGRAPRVDGRDRRLCGRRAAR